MRGSPSQKILKAKPMLAHQRNKSNGQLNLNKKITIRDYDSVAAMSSLSKDVSKG